MLKWNSISWIPYAPEGTTGIKNNNNICKIQLYRYRHNNMDYRKIISVPLDDV
jgi:hypothetical protein